LKPLNIAVIGIGDFGMLHIRALQENPLANLVAVCSRTPEKLKII